MTPKLKLLFILLLFLFPCAYPRDVFRIMFYNVENLFDTENNPLTQDDEFTPEGTRRWSKYRYYRKINNIAKVISSVGEWNYPALVGLCEVENNRVLDDLTKYSPLKKAQYRYIITESEDIRGINVALLYQREHFKYISHNNIPICFPNDSIRKTRDILHVTGEVLTGDTLDIFICHYPSRRGGEIESEPYRIFVSSLLREKTDSLFSCRKKENIIIMGDFNDESSNKSISEILSAKPIKEEINKSELYNLFLFLEQKSKIGTYKYQGQWNFLDRIIVSGNLLDQQNSFSILSETGCIYQADFLLTEDSTHGGKRPKKTFHGYKYEGGFSDHLPIMVDFGIEK